MNVPRDRGVHPPPRGATVRIESTGYRGQVALHFADAVRDPDPARRTGPTLEDAPGQVPRFPFIAEDIAPRPPGGADAVIGDFHHPDAEEIGPGLHAVVPRAVAGGIAGFEDDAEVEHGLGKETVYLYANHNANRFPCVLRSRKP